MLYGNLTTFTFFTKFLVVSLAPLHIPTHTIIKDECHPPTQYTMRNGRRVFLFSFLHSEIQIKSQLEAIDSYTTFQRVHKSPNFTGVNCALGSQLPGIVSATF